MKLLVHQIDHVCCDQLREKLKDIFLRDWFLNVSIGDKSQRVVEMFFEAFFQIDFFHFLNMLLQRMIVVLAFDFEFFILTEVKRKPMCERGTIESATNLMLCERSHVEKVHCWIDVLDLCGNHRFLQGHANSKCGFSQRSLCLETNQLLQQELLGCLDHDELIVIFTCLGEWRIRLKCSFVSDLRILECIGRLDLLLDL